MMAPLKSLCLSFVYLLAGCATLNSNFECPRKPGVSCKSLREVNQLVDEGHLGIQPDVKISRQVAVQPMTQIQVDTDKNINCSPEQVLAIWIAPFTDGAGRYHTAHTVYSVIRPGSWTAQQQESAYAH